MHTYCVPPPADACVASTHCVTAMFLPGTNSVPFVWRMDLTGETALPLWEGCFRLKVDRVGFTGPGTEHMLSKCQTVLLSFSMPRRVRSQSGAVDKMDVNSGFKTEL